MNECAMPAAAVTDSDTYAPYPGFESLKRKSIRSDLVTGNSWAYGEEETVRLDGGMESRLRVSSRQKAHSLGTARQEQR